MTEVRTCARRVRESLYDGQCDGLRRGEFDPEQSHVSSRQGYIRMAMQPSGRALLIVIFLQENKANITERGPHMHLHTRESVQVQWAYAHIHVVMRK